MLVWKRNTNYEKFIDIDPWIQRIGTFIGDIYN